ncbi:MAG: biosynthetic-type acetolactate synthase large subunit [Tannerella sp.]|uniref:biosynthetic-type acetolactate synthase large subunit n=1 Tax=uncultured Coprobacter sp. TaxID=1720550 RepID=UPI002606F685|nr:biosynthetic-type acetolactate synthase large subunit [uncultured Coprobacter sp.]MBS6267869.1 biosynthetic-type acetolactate synthase large subunit [Tannerella sp.]
MATDKISGSEALIRSLLEENVKLIYGYPGGAIMPVFDCMHNYKDRLKHVLVRHEQGATHAAQGFARVSGETGVVLVTSGPAATNIITGVADAMVDSTPLVVITGQINSSLLGTDAFQETDVVGITQPVTKWSYQIRRTEDITWAVARAFYIARSGRPGPVVLDFTKDAQVGTAEFHYQKCNFIRSYNPYPKINEDEINRAATLINQSKKPLLLIGQGVILSHAENEILRLMEKADIPAGCTLLGLSAIPTAHRLNKGMLGMHGNIGPNIKTNECDLLIAVGMRFDDRVTGGLNTYAKQAKVIHFDIDPSEFNKNVHADVTVLGDAKESLSILIDKVCANKHAEWLSEFEICEKTEYEKVIRPEVYPENGALKMGEVVRKVSEATGNNAILVTDVGQNQMMGARYFNYTRTRSIVTSGGLGTMGFGLPAAIGAKMGAPDRTVCFFTGDGGIQMTIQELGTVMQTGTDIKIIILNNNFLGMVRQWQELFFEKRYSETHMLNPDFAAIAAAYGIKGRDITDRSQLDEAIAEMIAHKGAYLLNVAVEEEGMVFPMIPAGGCVTDILLNSTEKY